MDGRNESSRETLTLSVSAWSSLIGFHFLLTSDSEFESVREDCVKIEEKFFGILLIFGCSAHLGLLLLGLTEVLFFFFFSFFSCFLFARIQLVVGCKLKRRALVLCNRLTFLGTKLAEIFQYVFRI